MKRFRYIIIFVLICMMEIKVSDHGAVLAKKSEAGEEEYDIKLEVTAKWDHHYNLSVFIENTGESTIENWEISFILGGTIENIWNANIIKHEDSSYAVKNNKWNQDIQPHSTIEFGMTVCYKDQMILPEFFNMVKECKEVDRDYEVKNIIYNQWDTGVTGVIRILNKSDKPIEDWKVCIRSNLEFVDMWNARIEQTEKNLLYLNNCNYNSNINPGEYIDIGFNAVCNGDWYINDFKLFELCVLVQDTVDDDNDGLYDYLENNIYNTNPHSADSDEDGLNDYYEVVVLNTDPLNADENNNNKNDGQDDFDEDKLVNSLEEDYGTDAYKDDTDEDGLTDSIEICTYKTDPLDEDTDSDGIKDGVEVDNKLDPLVKDDLESLEKEPKQYMTEYVESDMFEYVNVTLHSFGDIEDHVDISEDEMVDENNTDVLVIENDISKDMSISLKIKSVNANDTVIIYKYNNETWDIVARAKDGDCISVDTSDKAILRGVAENKNEIDNEVRITRKKEGSQKRNQENRLRKRLYNQSTSDLGIKRFIKTYNSNKAIDIILKYGDYIKTVASEYKINKSLIQALLFREIICYDFRDDVADMMVKEYFSYMQRLDDYNKAKWYEKIIMGVPYPRFLIKEDCSTGLGQVFSKTAIRAINFEAKRYLDMNIKNWKYRRRIWGNLNGNDYYNIRCIARIIKMESAGVNGVNLEYPNKKHVKLILTRYNSGGKNKISNYGKKCYRYFKCFRSYNNKVD